MAKRKRIWSVGVVLVLLAGFAWLVLRPHELVFEGRPLSRLLLEGHWVGDYWYYRGQGVATTASRYQAERAVRALGTKLLPLLVKWAGTRFSGFRDMVGVMAREPDFDYLHLPPQEGKPETAAWAFGLLGATAQPAVPALVRLLQDREPSVLASAAECLGQIGPAAAAAVPGLVQVLRNQTGAVQRRTFYRLNSDAPDAAARALGAIGPAASAAIPYLVDLTNEVAQVALLRIRQESLRSFVERLQDTSDARAWSRVAHEVSRLGTNADPAIPLLLAALQRTNSTIQGTAWEVLRELQRRPELCVPALTALLKSRNDGTRASALEILGAFGPAASPAVPEITTCLGDRNEWVRWNATNALRAVDPAAAARAGIK